MTLSIADILTLVGIGAALLTGAVIPVVLYFKNRLNTVTDNHLDHLQQSVREAHWDLSRKVDSLSSDVQILSGRIEGWNLNQRVSRLERICDE